MPLSGRTNEASTVFASVIKEKTVLQYLVLIFDILFMREGVVMSDFTGVALAEAVNENITLRALKLELTSELMQMN